MRPVYSFLLLPATAVALSGAAGAVGLPFHPRTLVTSEVPRPAAFPSETGRIEGQATIAASLTNARPRVRVYDEPGTPPPKPVTDKHPLENVVIYLASSANLRGITPPSAHPAPALRQSDERFVPHVLPVLVGSTVDFPNDDPIFHNVFSLSSLASFDLGRYPKGSSKTHTFTRPGVVQVFCHIHADMSAYIVVVDNAFFVTPDSLGHFVLDGIPPGDYTLMAWHERIQPKPLLVHVEAGRTTSVKLSLPIADRP